jgi:NDP-sugar pyrophosphorylase family protein
MTDLIDSTIKKGLQVGAFPIFEYWTDIGTTEDLEKARRRLVDVEITIEKE